MRKSKEIVEIIKNNRKKLNLSQRELAKRVGISNSTLSRYEKEEREFPINDIGKFAKALNLELNYLLGIIDTEENKTKGIKIPVLGEVAAGIPIEAMEDIIDYEEITENMARSGDFFGLQIRGDSMQPKMDSGDVVIVRQQPDAETGDTVIAIINGDNATCKKLKKTVNGIMLISTNSNYEPMFFTWKEVEEKPVKIIGKVVELRAKF